MNPDLATNVYNLGVEMNRQRSEFIRRRQEEKAMDDAAAAMRRESAIQATADRLDVFAAFVQDGRTPDVRIAAEQIVRAVLAQLGSR